MSTTLGLDIGTTSIGWCLMEDKDRIVRSGVRIFPVGVQEDKYAKSSVEESKNAARRTARGIRRGYDRYKLRRKQLRRILLELNMLPERLEMPSARALYELRVRALDEKLSLQEIGRVLLHLNQRRGFKSNRKTDPREGQKERSVIKLQMNTLKQRVIEQGFRTVGEYFFSLYRANESVENWHNPDEPIQDEDGKGIRRRFVLRSMYEEEFDAIWKAQSIFYPSILTEERRREIKERCIYYQRPLKSQKGRVGRCRFEPKKRVAPRSSLAFQEFRIWETLSRIRVTDNKRHLNVLTLEEKKTLAAALSETDKLKIAKIRTYLRLPKTAYFNDIDEIKGNTTATNIIDVIGSDAWQSMTEDEREHLWHILYFASDESWLKKWALEHLDLSDEDAERFSEISLEPDYSRISHKAIAKILPYMREGMDYSQACNAVGYHHSFDEEVQGKERMLEDKIVRKASDEIEQLRNPLVMRAVGETVSLVNAIIQEEGRPDQIRIEFARSMKLPKDVRQALRNKNLTKERQRDEYRAFLTNRLGWADISKSQITKFELWLEMEFAEEDLRKLNASIDAVEFAKFAEKVKPSDKQKYELWLECGRRSPYTGEVISLRRLFDSDIEIEHIIPYSRSFDNSFRNKTLCEREFNARKGADTALEYFTKQGEEPLRQFKERIKALPRIKQERLLQEEFEDFRPGSLESTAWIAKEAKKILMRVCRDVRVTDGQVTSTLRRFWGLNTLLNPDGDNEKTRKDHRHHAVDAFVIANTKDWWINLLSQASAFDPHRKLSDNLQELLRTPAGRDLVEAAGLGVDVVNEHAPLNLQNANPATGEIAAGGIPGPYANYRQELEGVLARMFISYRKNARLISSKLNNYRYSRSKSGSKKQHTVAVRGSLHQDSLFGKILDSNTHELTYVKRERVDNLSPESLNLIVDKGIRKALEKHLSTGLSLKDQAYLFSREGDKQIPIRHVRIKTDKKNLVEIRPNTFVMEGDNYVLAIYGKDGAKRREREVASFFKASQRALKKQPIFPSEINGLPLLMTLQKSDLIATYDKHPDELDLGDLPAMFGRLFRIIEIGSDKIIYARHFASAFDKKKDRNTLVFQANFNTLRAIKIGVSITGRLIA